MTAADHTARGSNETPAPILDLSAFEKAGQLLAKAWLEQTAARGAYIRGLLGGLYEGQGPAAEAMQSARANNAEDEIERLRGRVAERDALFAAMVQISSMIGGRPVEPITMVAAVQSVVDQLRSARASADELTGERDDYANRLRETDRAYADVTAERDAMHEAFTAMQHVLNRAEERIAKAPAEPRRWHVGEPEPEIGTTVQSARGGIYTLLKSGYWHRIDGCVHDDPNNCIEAGYSWKWLTGHDQHLPLVEVVGTDGD